MPSITQQRAGLGLLELRSSWPMARALSCLGLPEEEKSSGSKARSQGVGPEVSATTPQPVWDSWDLIRLIYFPSRAAGCGRPPEKGVGSRFHLPLLGQFREEQVSTAPASEGNKVVDPAPVGPEPLASQRNCPGEESSAGAGGAFLCSWASQAAQW